MIMTIPLITVNFRIPENYLPKMKLFFITAACSLLAITLQAQKLIGDTTFIQASKNNAIGLYGDALKDVQMYFNGSAYVEVPRTGEQHAYFVNDDWQVGTLLFEGNLFSNVYMLYDLTADQIVTESPIGNLLAITPEKVTGFTMGKHTFVRIVKPSVDNGLPRTGNYEVLYNGKSRVLGMYEKELQRKIENTEFRFFFLEHYKYFILKNGIYHQVKTKKSVLKLFPEQKHALKSYARKNRIYFRNNQQVALPRIVGYYDTLIAK
jgi:hypothetical protein